MANDKLLTNDEWPEMANDNSALTPDYLQDPVDGLADELVAQFNDPDWRQYYCGLIHDLGIPFVQELRLKAGSGDIPVRLFKSLAKRAQARKRVAMKQYRNQPQAPRVAELDVLPQNNKGVTIYTPKSNLDTQSYNTDTVYIPNDDVGFSEAMSSNIDATVTNMHQENIFTDTDVELINNINPPQQDWTHDGQR